MESSRYVAKIYRKITTLQIYHIDLTAVLKLLILKIALKFHAELYKRFPILN